MDKNYNNFKKDDLKHELLSQTESREQEKN